MGGRLMASPEPRPDLLESKLDWGTGVSTVTGLEIATGVEVCTLIPPARLAGPTGKIAGAVTPVLRPVGA